MRKFITMRFPSPVSVRWLADFLGAELAGDKNGQATGINEIHKVENGDLVFVDHPKYYDTCLRSAASYVIIDKAVEVPPGKAILIVEQPFEAYLRIVRHFRPFEPAVVPRTPHMRYQIADPTTRLDVQKSARPTVSENASPLVGWGSDHGHPLPSALVDG